MRAVGMRALFALIIALPPTSVAAHSGGTDEYGCHNSPSGYHCHDPGDGGGSRSAAAVVAFSLLLFVGILIYAHSDDGPTESDGAQCIEDGFCHATCSDNRECRRGALCVDQVCALPSRATSSIRFTASSGGIGFAW